jgi:hypothetical protein
MTPVLAGRYRRELAALTVEPSPIDRVAVAKAALRRIEGSEVVTVFRDCFNELTQPEQNAIQEASRGGGAADARG